MISRRERTKILVMKWALYSLLLLVATTIQTAPGLLAIGEVRPVLILTVCIAVAIYEGEYPGAAFGAISGLLWDYTAGRISGLFALLLLVLCFAAAVLVQLYLRVNTMNGVLVNAAAALVLLSTDFMFFFIMPGYANAGTRYLNVVLPMVVFTAALSPFALLAVRAIHQKFTQPE